MLRRKPAATLLPRVAVACAGGTCALPLLTPAGAGESGKSTIFKQMKILYGTGFKEEDRRQQVPVMHSNVISSMNTLIAAAEELELPVQAQV